MSKILDRALTINGAPIKVGSNYITPVLYHFDLVSQGYVTGAPTGGEAGFEKGCKLTRTDGSTTTTFYVNTGTSTSATWTAILPTAFIGLTDVPAAFTAAGDKIVKVNTGATALEFVTPSGDVTMSALGAFTIAAAAVNPAKLVQDVAITATTDGTTTGLIGATAFTCTVTSSSSAIFATLPTAVVGKSVNIFVGANGCKICTIGSSGVKINNVDCSAGAGASLPANTLAVCYCTSATTWLLTAYNTVGAVITAIIPA